MSAGVAANRMGIRKPSQVAAPGLDTGLRTAVWWAILCAILVNAASLFTPIINEGDSVLYAALSQHMVATGNWADLVLDGRDWLDKPHFPFWLGALSFEVFGISAFSYILPGFLFHLLGGYYTYRIARLFYGRDSALLALLLYVSTYHLMYTSSAVKAEAFLTGTITAACYYWLRYDQLGRLKYLLLGALFSALSVMTKGIFTLITISGGLVVMWLYQGQWRKLLAPKWWLAAALTVLFTAPEVLSLWLQFDRHPEKVVFGQTNVSGVKFFLWDSQFGRFFNSGPIKNTEGTPLYFVHVFAWAYLPWVAVFVAALVGGVRRFAADTANGRAQFVFLCATFFVTFVLFSATAFQLDYYTVILFPFANILCAHWLARFLLAPPQKEGKAFVVAHGLVTLVTWALALGLAVYVGNRVLLVLVLCGTAVALLWAWWRHARLPALARRSRAVLLYPVAAVSLLYLFLEGMTLYINLNYSVPWNVKPLLAAEPDTPVLVWRLDSTVAWELGLYRTSAPSTAVADAAQLPAPGKGYFLVLHSDQVPALAPKLGAFRQVGQGDWVDHKTGILPRQLALARGAEPLERFSVLRVGTP